MTVNEITWRRVDHGIINEPLVDYLEGLIETQLELGNTLKLCIGTDSQVKGKGFKYATAIILEMKQPMGIVAGEMTYKGLGAKVISGVFFEKQLPRIKERMLKEVQLSINVGYHLLDLVEVYEVDLEIHADVNPKEDAGSNCALKEAIGFMTGMGFKYKVKPDAYAASSGADKLCQ